MRCAPGSSTTRPSKRNSIGATGQSSIRIRTRAPILTAARASDVTLLYSSHDTEHNNAVVLRDYLNERLERRWPSKN
jgi:hypothetical protein